MDIESEIKVLSSLDMKTGVLALRMGTFQASARFPPTLNHTSSATFLRLAPSKLIRAIGSSAEPLQWAVSEGALLFPIMVDLTTYGLK